MQLISATTLLLASIVGTSTATILDRGITVMQGTGDERFCTVACKSGTCIKLEHCGGSRRRQLEAEERMLEVTPMQPAKGATLNSELPIHFQVGGLSGTAELILKRDGCGTVTEPLEFGAAGVANEFLKPRPAGCSGDGDYQWSVKVTSEEGDEEVLEGGTFKYEHPAEPAAPVAKSRARVGNIQTNSGSSASGGAGSNVNEAPYELGGEVQTAVGRIYFASFGVDYACTGTAIKDHKTGRSLIFTAAHCVWDDIDANFGANVIFIPNRDARYDVSDTNVTALDIHRGCSEDPCGCWQLSGGVVPKEWKETSWPYRLEYDYGFYVVEDEGKHMGADCGGDALDIAVPAQEILSGATEEGEFITNLGYSLEYNPDFRYCAQETTVRSPAQGIDTLFMDKCGLSGGASGGPWIKSFDSETGSGKVVTTNSWSYGNIPGMGGPFIPDSEFRCLINKAREADVEYMMAQSEGNQGIFADCFDRPCIEDETGVRKLRGGRKLCSEIIKREEAKP